MAKCRTIRVEIREVPGIPDIGASRDGRVWRITEPRRNGSNKGLKVPYPLKPMTNKALGYQYINVYGLDGPGTQCVKYVHDLVSSAFHGPKPDGHQVDHDDGDRANNVASNLKYRTSGNHCQKHILERAKKLDPQKVQSLLQALANGVTIRGVAERFGISPVTVWKTKHGLYWHQEWLKFHEGGGS